MVEGRSPTKLDEPFHHAAGSVQAPFFFHHPPTLLLECAHRVAVIAWEQTQWTPCGLQCLLDHVVDSAFAVCSLVRTQLTPTTVCENSRDSSEHREKIRNFSDLKLGQSRMRWLRGKSQVLGLASPPTLIEVRGVRDAPFLHARGDI